MDTELLGGAIAEVVSDPEVIGRFGPTSPVNATQAALAVELEASADEIVAAVTDAQTRLDGAQSAFDLTSKAAVKAITQGAPEAARRRSELNAAVENHADAVAAAAQELADAERAVEQLRRLQAAKPRFAWRDPAHENRRRRSRGGAPAQEPDDDGGLSAAYDRWMRAVHLHDVASLADVGARSDLHTFETDLLDRAVTAADQYPELVAARHAVEQARVDLGLAIQRAAKAVALDRLAEPLPWQDRWRSREVAPAPADAPALTAARDGEASVFRAFTPAAFAPWPVWPRVEAILRSNGGSYGISGARGAGKSWLMARALAWVAGQRDRSPLGGIGLWYPSPSEHDPLAFLASLTDGFAGVIERWHDQAPAVRAAGVRGRAALVVAVVLAALAVVLALATGAPLAVPVVVAALALASALSGAIYLSHFSRERALAAEARRVRERARFSAARRESVELGAEASRVLTGRLRRLRERELTERPATISSLVADFRALARQAAEVTGHVVVAIDELDKMDDAQHVRELLRSAKGIFEVEHVHFLMSVSDEAARTLSLGAFSVRDEFNSSFYTVLEVPPATPDQLADLLDGRSGKQIPREVGVALAVLAGGNPRDTIRLADNAVGVVTRDDAVLRTLRDEALVLRRDVVTALDQEGAPGLTLDERRGAFAALPDDAFKTSAQFAQFTQDALSDALWSPAWEGEGFSVRFGEAWRRLLVRVAVAGAIVRSQSLISEPELALQLRDVVALTSQSAHVARIVLEEQLTVQTRRDDIGRGPALVGLEQHARTYEWVRAELPSGAERTVELDKVVTEARHIARDARLRTDELRALLVAPRQGDRVVGLAAVQATADQHVAADVLSIAVNPRTPFEGYHALLGLEALAQGMAPAQAATTIEALRMLLRVDAVGRDTARRQLIDRILAALEQDRVGEQSSGQGRELAG